MDKNPLETRAQQVVRIFVRPVFPALQKVIQSLGLMREALTVEGPYRRQPYLIRMMAPEETPDLLVERLTRAGFTHEPIALNEHGQVASMRKICDAHADHQYHVRIFSDGEIKGHYEYTPEDKPFSHWQERIFEEKKEQFLSWLA